jgi:DNA primase
MDKISPQEVKTRIRLAQVVSEDLGAPVKRYRTWHLYFCPFHENTRTPALALNVETDTFKCFSCGVHGDIFDWHMQRHQVDFKTALAYYREQLHDGTLNAPEPTPQKQADWDTPPDNIWQLQGYTFLQRSQLTLWKNAGEPGRRELHRRGITPDTARRWGLGYNPRWYKEPGNLWGLVPDKAVWLPRGLVIPGLVGVDLWYLKVRLFGSNGRPVGKRAGRNKYLQVRGSRPAMYGSNLFRGHPCLLLAESELDAILAWQESEGCCDVATLGGAGKHLSTRWMMDMLPYRRIVVAYDRDKAGRRGAQELARLSERLVVAPPPAGDLCDFHQAGGDLRAWLWAVCGA